MTILIFSPFYLNEDLVLLKIILFINTVEFRKIKAGKKYNFSGLSIVSNYLRFLVIVVLKKN